MPDSFRKVLKDKPFTVLDNEALRDPRLSLKARGLLCTCMSLPPDWNFSIRGLATVCKEGRDAIAAALTELERAGYLRRNRIQGRGEDGTFGGTEYVFFEDPQSAEDNPAPPWPEKPATDEPATENPSPENPPQQNKEIQSKDKQKAPVAPMDADLMRRVADYAGSDAEIYDALIGFAEMRKKNRKPINTDRTLTLLLSRLNELSKGSRKAKLMIIDRSTLRGWRGFFPLDGDEAPVAERTVEAPPGVATW